MQLFLIDAIGPFFRAHPGRTINWSKIPFQHIPVQGPECEARWAQIRADLHTFCAKASEMGFNAVTLDDVTHLADHSFYSLETRATIGRWRSFLGPCLDIPREYGLKVFVTMDVFSSTPSLREHLEQTRLPVNTFLSHLLDSFLDDFPAVEGVVVRIGESDARDVEDEFRSELHVRTPLDANRLLRALLPVFEKRQKRLIFRTWTVGAYRVGDLMWSPATLTRALKGIEESPSLIVSMKHGESDFFRYLPLNKNFFQTKAAKLVELQTRREYEGCGEFPSFVGWEHERFARELEHASNLVGISVWSQTGGWVPFRRLTFLDRSAVWTDLNTFVTLRVFKDKQLVEEAIREFAQSQNCPDETALLELLRLSDEVVRELLYVEDFARQALFFRRVRVPPMLQVYWNNIFISHSVKKVLNHFVQDKEASLRAAQRALENIGRMRTLATAAAMPEEDIAYMEATFSLLTLAREYYFSPFTEEIEQRLRIAKKAYKAQFPKEGGRARYRVKMNFQPFWLRYRHLRWALAVLMRRKSGYRLVDRIFTLHGISLIYRVIAKRRPHWIPSFAKDSAMGVESVMR